MKRRAFACRRDANEHDIVRALRGIGCSVHRLNAVDLLVGYRGRKDGAKAPSARKLTADQLIFRAEWRGQYDVVTGVDEAIAAVQRHTLGRAA